jgi:hypothetical protein
MPTLLISILVLVISIPIYRGRNLNAIILQISQSPEGMPMAEDSFEMTDEKFASDTHCQRGLNMNLILNSNDQIIFT